MNIFGAIGRNLSPLRTKPIVVGIDGSRAALRSVGWAAAEGAATGSSLHLVHVAEHAPSERNRAALEAARHAVLERNSSVRVDTEIIRGRSSPDLSPG